MSAMTELQKEKKIPAFTVFKKGMILKNIFLLDKNTSPPPQSTKFIKKHNPKVEIDSELEEILLIGRHPNCNIFLEHPSISRFHLEIHLQPSLQKLFIVDLSSVHGTWVSDRKIEPQVRVELVEGDILRLGTSTRSYRLHWFPLSSVFDVENRPDSKNPLPADEKEDEKMLKNENPAPMMPEYRKFTFTNYVGEVLLPCSICNDEENRSPIALSGVRDTEMSDYENPSPDDGDEGDEMPKNENLSSFEQKLSPSEPPILQSMQLSLADDVKNSEEEKHSPCVECDPRNLVVLPNSENRLLPNENDMHSFEKPSVNDEDEEENMLRNENLISVDDMEEVLSPSLICSEEEKYSPSVVCDPGHPVVLQNFETTLLSDEKDMHNFGKSSASDEDEEENMLKNDNLISVDDGEEVLSPSSIQNEEKHSPVVLWDVQNPVVLRNSQIPLPPDENDMPKFENSFSPDDKMLTNEYPISFGRKLNPSAPPMPEFMNFTFTDDNQEVLSPSSIQGDKENHGAVAVLDQGTILSTSSAPLTPDYVTSTSLHVESVSQKTMKQQFDDENQEKSPATSKTASLWSRRGKPTSLAPKVSYSNLDGDEHILTPEKESYTRKAESDIQSSCGSLFSSQDRDNGLSTFSDKENLTPIVLKDSRLKKPFSGSKLRQDTQIIIRQEAEMIMSRRAAGRLPFQSLGGSCISYSKSEDRVPITSSTRSTCPVIFYQGDLTPKALFSSSEAEAEILTPDKEENTPKTGYKSRLIKSGQKGYLQLQNSYESLSPSSVETFSEKENLTPVVLRDSSLKRPLSASRLRQEADMIMSKRKAVGRVPFQSLINSISASNSEVLVPITNTPSTNTGYCGKTIETTVPFFAKQTFKRWHMVVDTDTLLNKESRKSLQLLRGLRRTQIIIPQMVMKELDSLKRRGGLFGSARAASAALQWIQECEAETSWWINIQNFSENILIEQTPPASKEAETSWWIHIQNFSENILIEQTPPASKDHTLSYALYFRKTLKDDGQVVLLSDDTDLKIKAMTEGLLCETVEEFRESIVNPYSRRFLWAGSMPRGLTWSCSELRENYFFVPVKNTAFIEAKSAKEGLKLISRCMRR